MIVALTIVHYFVAAGVDLLDKILLTRNRIRPLQYAFYTVVTGALVLAAWPFVYAPASPANIAWSVLSGVAYSLALYLLFRAMSHGEVSRVVPFVFGLMPVFDLVIGWAFGRNTLTPLEFAAIWLLVPGALLISYRNGFAGRHVAVKLAASFSFSAYYALWQVAGQSGPVMNSMMWNRLGSAAALLLLLALPAARAAIFSHHAIEHKSQASWLFVGKQLVGGLNFYFLSWLLVVGKISVIDSLQGFRYVFLLALAAFLTHKFRHILAEETGRHALRQKAFALALIFLGTLMLFLA